MRIALASGTLPGCMQGEDSVLSCRMDKRVEYQVCYSIDDRVTMVNGVWQGDEVPESNRKQEDVRSCPLVWDYLNEVGDLGWVLVNVLETRMEGPQGPRFVRTLYLKRSI